MYVGVAIYNLKPGKKVEATRIWEESFFPVAKQQKNFKAALWLVAPDTDKAIGLELWDLDVAASSFETSGLFQQLADKFRNVVVCPPEREQYETTGALVFIPGGYGQQTGVDNPGSVQGKPAGPAFRILSA
jgi:hypothetical protein